MLFVALSLSFCRVVILEKFCCMWCFLFLFLCQYHILSRFSVFYLSLSSLSPFFFLPHFHDSREHFPIPGFERFLHGYFFPFSAGNALHPRICCYFQFIIHFCPNIFSLARIISGQLSASGTMAVYASLLPLSGLDPYRKCFKSRFLIFPDAAYPHALRLFQGFFSHDFLSLALFVCENIPTGIFWTSCFKLSHFHHNDASWYHLNGHPGN